MSELLKVAESFSAISVFNCDNTQSIIDKIRAEATAEVFDINTAKGRKGVAAMAHKVAKSKVALDNLGKDLVADWKQKAKSVDAERKKLRDELDIIKTEVRAPLTEWEEATAKAAAAKAAAEKLAADHGAAIIDDNALDAQRELERKLAEVEAEKQRLHDEEQCRVAAQAEIDRVAQIKLDAERAAKDKARAEVEAARLEKEQAWNEAAKAKIEAERAAERAEIKAELDRQAADDAAKQAEIDAKRAAEEAARRAQAEKDEAIQRVKDEAAAKEAARIRAEEQAEQERQKLARNRAHKAKTNNAILEDLLKIVGEGAAKKIIGAAAKGKIRFLTVNY